MIKRNRSRTSSTWDCAAEPLYVLDSECDAGLYIGYTCDLSRSAAERRRGNTGGTPVPHGLGER